MKLQEDLSAANHRIEELEPLAAAVGALRKDPVLALEQHAAMGMDRTDHDARRDTNTEMCCSNAALVEQVALAERAVIEGRQELAALEEVMALTVGDVVGAGAM
jgi:hypothetical protein